MSNTELALHEERAQHGIIEFAEEMQAIRDGNLYPHAGEHKEDAWATYCKERWGMGRRTVDDTILALPVLRRLENSGAAVAGVSVSAAAKVATLPESVQDAILTESPKRDAASDKAKAARKEAERIRTQEGREPEDEELIEATKTVKQAHKPKSKMKPSKFTSMLSQAVSWAEDAADYAQSNVLDDVENEFAFSRVEKLRYHADRIAERIHRPEHVRDLDEEAAALLGGDER